jgi:hypothetical protein
MSNMNVAWLGPESKLSENLEEALDKKIENKKLNWNNYSIEEETLGDFFVKHKKEEFNWIFVDFTNQASYKIDLTKILGKYSTFRNSTLIGVIGKKTDILLETDFLGLPLNVLCTPKKDVDDILEDIEIVTGNGKVNEDYFKTLGFNHVLWVQMPCRANYKERTIKLYPQTMDFAPIKDLKKEMLSMDLNEDSLEYMWSNQPNDFMSVTIHEESGKELFFQGNEFKKRSNDGNSKSFKIKLPEKEVLEFGDAISEKRVSKDRRKRVLVFDPQMELFTRCWGKNYLNEKVNMFNFPYFTSDFRILNALAPEMVIIRASKQKGDGGVEEIQLLELLEQLKRMKTSEPSVVIFNSPELVTANSDKLLKVPFDLNSEFADKLIDILAKGGELEVGDEQLEVHSEILEWRNARLENLVFLNLPLVIKEISENYIKVKCPFRLNKPLIVYEPYKFGAYLAFSPHLDANDREAIYGGIFVGESEDQKTEIRKYVNEINFTPKTEEQLKELQEFHAINTQKLKEMEEAE